MVRPNLPLWPGRDLEGSEQEAGLPLTLLLFPLR
jgi:hypothetical protein